MKILKSSAFVLAVNITEVLSIFLRNTIFARLLSVQDFGIVATFTLLASFLDLSGQAGLDRMVVQAKDADEPGVQETVHTVQFGLGAISALMILAISAPYASFSGTPDLYLAYASLALIPIFKGLAHLDRVRMQRRGQFGPWAARQILPSIGALIAIYPGYVVFKDYRAALVSIFVQQFLALALSHFGSERRFAFSFDRLVMIRALHFGWPMTVNSILLYFVFNGDRLVVSNLFGLETLGLFSAAIMLTLTPINFVARTVQTTLLPMMSKANVNGHVRQIQYNSIVSIFVAAALSFSGFIFLFGKEFLVLVLGARFAAAAHFLEVLAICQAIRLIRAAPALLAMSCGDTKNPMLANMMRGIFIVLSAASAYLTKNLELMLVIAVIGELIATYLSGILARKSDKTSQRYFFVTTTLCFVSMSLMYSASQFTSPVVCLVAAAALAVAAIWRLPQAFRSLHVSVGS